MLSSMNANPKDPFFIASVPRYKENIAEDNNDSIGDEYFERLASEQLAEENQAPPPKKEPTVPSTRRSVMPSAPMPTRRSVMPVMPMPSSRRSVMPPATPLMNTNSRRPSSFSVAAAPNTVAKQPVIVQPPMRFGGGANTARHSVLPTETRVAAAATRRSVMPAPSTPLRPSTAKQPVIVQPPMRFGNAPTTRRSVMPEAPTTSTASGSSSRAPKPNDISHAVRGIPVRRSSRDRAPSRDKQPK